MLQPNSYNLTPVLFLGTPAFAIPILEALAQHHRIIAVITQPDKPAGRKGTLTESPIKIHAKAMGLSVFQPATSAEIAKTVAPLPPFDFLITAAYGKILPESVLKLAKKDALNVHGSLLPKYRGATPMQAALLNGDKETGITIFRMVKELDAGPIFAQRPIPIPPDMMFPWLEKECSKLGAEFLLEVLQQYDQLTPKPQDEKLATHCGKIKKEDGLVRFEEETAEQIFNKLRAYTPWPGVYTFWNGKKLSLLDFVPHQRIEPPHVAGTVFQEDGKVFIACHGGAVEVLRVQLAGKNPMTIQAFLNGHKDFVGFVLHS